MMNDLLVTTVQTPLHWEDVDANLNMFDGYIAQVTKSDLVILPEMFTTGFTMNAKNLAEEMGGKTMKWLKEQAQKIDAVITGSIIIHEKGKYYNRLIWMRPDGTYDHYDKRHLFAMAGEHKSYTSGSKKLIVELNGWRVCPLICYDLRFPVWARNQDDYDLLIFTANWPEKRASDWRTLLHARAIENQSFVIGVNRIGLDDNGYRYTGDTSVIAPGPKGIIYHTQDNPDITTHLLESEDLIKTRSHLPFLKDRDLFIIP
jgi:omega-amidase